MKKGRPQAEVIIAEEGDLVFENDTFVIWSREAIQDLYDKNKLDMQLRTTGDGRLQLICVVTLEEEEYAETRRGLSRHSRQ